MLAALFVAAGATAQHTFNHGPYLQGVTEGEASIYFTTSGRGFSWVEAREKGSSAEARRYVTTRHGLIEAYNTRNAIRLEDLRPGTEYEYRMVSKEMVDFQPYKVTYGDSITSPWYSFRTVDPRAKEYTFAVVSDIHGDAEKYTTLLVHLPMEEVQTVFLNGDTVDYFVEPDQLYPAYIDASVEMFATGKPFVAIRGNHETRGALAREYHNYVYRPNGEYYGLYKVGDTAVVVLDCGEDKPDSHPVYAGLVDFYDYRARQAEWLKGVVESDEFRSAGHRVVMIHIPPIDRAEADEDRYRELDGGTQQVYDFFVPVLNGAGVDVMMCGHTHRQMLFEPQEDRDFPVVVNDNRSASLVRVSSAGVNVRTVDVDGNVTLERVF